MHTQLLLVHAFVRRKCAFIITLGAIVIVTTTYNAKTDDAKIENTAAVECAPADATSNAQCKIGDTDGENKKYSLGLVPKHYTNAKSEGCFWRAHNYGDIHVE